MNIHVSRWYRFCFGALSSHTCTRWCRWRSRSRSLRSWWIFSHAIVPSVCLWIHCCAIVARKTGFHLIFRNQFWVSIYHTFTSLCPANTTPQFFSFRTSAGGFLICCSISSIPAPKNPPLPIVAIFKVRCMSECSSCTWHPCLTIVADMLKTYKKLVAASKVRSNYFHNDIRIRNLL